MPFQNLKEKYAINNEDFYEHLHLRDYFLKEISNTETINALLNVRSQTCNEKKFKAVPESQRL